MNLIPRSLLVCTAALTLLSGCGGGGSSSSGYVRLVNATTAYSDLSLYSSTTLLTSDVASNTVGAYYGLGAGTYTLNIAGPGSSSTVATYSGTVSTGYHYALVSYVVNGALNSAWLAEDETAPDAGTAKLRIYNTAYANVGNVDAYLVSSDCSALASSSAGALVSSVATVSSYVEVTAATAGTAYHLCVTAAGDKSDLRLDIPSITLTNQDIDTLILTDTSGGTLLNGLLLKQQGALTPELNTSARVRVAVGAASGAAVTASVNGVTLGTALTAPAVGSYKLVTAGTLTPTITVGGTAVTASGLTATAGADLTLLVNGTAASTPVLIKDNNAVSTSSSYPVKLRLVNGLNGTSGAATLTDDYIAIGDGAASGTATDYTQVAASAALGRLEATYGASQLCLSTGVTLTTGHVYSVFLLGDLPTASTTCTIRVDR